jgi:hypothetical protein
VATPGTDARLSDCFPTAPPPFGKIGFGSGSFVFVVCDRAYSPPLIRIEVPFFIGIEGEAYNLGEVEFFIPNEQSSFPFFQRRAYSDIPITCAAGAQVGELEIWFYSTNEAVITGSIPPVNEEDYYQGFPVACWPLPPGPSHRPWSFSPFDAGWRQFAAEVLCFQYRDPPTALAKLTAFLGPNYAITKVDNSDSVVPGTMIAVTSGRVVIFISGTTHLEQLVLQAVQSFNPPTDRGGYSTLPLWDMACNEIFQRMNSAHVGASDELCLVGHSYGGACAQIIAYRMARANPRRRISLLTYAAPPVGKLPNSGEYPSPIVSSFIINRGDPVASLPPAISYLESLQPFLPGMPFAAWSQWRRPRQTSQLLEDGTIVDNGDPAVDLAQLGAFLAIIIAGGPFAMPSAHYMDAYVARLYLPGAPPTPCGDPGP